MFQLHYTRADGTEGGRGADFETAHVAAVSVLAAFRDELVDITATEGRGFTNELYAADLGTGVEHGPSGIIFTIVEF